MIRPAELVLPELRKRLPGVCVVSDVTDADHRQFPLIIITPTGGPRHPKSPMNLRLANISMSANTRVDFATAATLYDRALDALYDMQETQEVTDKGWLHSVTELMGATRANPLFEDTWRVIGTIRLGLRPLHTTTI